MGMIIGDQLTKISLERGKLTNKMTISSNVGLVGVEKQDFNLGGEKKKGLSFDYKFEVKYGESSGNISINGSIFYTDKEAELDKIASQWTKDKKVDTKLILPILNKALEIGNLQALFLAKQASLPLPMRMPKFTEKK